jgi:hypothetical protein
MQARDATGRQVSLLNDDAYPRPSSLRAHSYSTSARENFAAPAIYRTSSYYQPTREEDSPPANTPELLRSDSYDSHTSYEPLSPMTPVVYDYSSQAYDEYMSDKPHHSKRPALVSSRAVSYDDDSSSLSTERPVKRYPCRYRDSHGCEKTFTTSGHASRHSKIHTAEKAVQCTFAGCHKKFTRADNMKQHLETHFKDKSRSSSSVKAAKSSSASSKRGSVSSRSTTSQSSRVSRDVQMWDVEQYGHESPPLPQGDAWDIRSLNSSLLSRPTAARTSSGLDALAAIACQETA